MPSQYIFLDRDGTIIKDKHHMHKTKDIEFLPRAVEGLRKLQSIGFQLIIISNQSGVTRGYFSKEEAEYFHKEVLKKLKDENIAIRDSLFCYHREEDGCSCRKPKTGLVKKATKRFKISLSDSFFVGDKDCDIELGKNCKGKTILIKNGQYRATIKPDFTANNLNEVHLILLDSLPWSKYEK